MINTKWSLIRRLMKELQIPYKILRFGTYVHFVKQKINIHRVLKITQYFVQNFEDCLLWNNIKVIPRHKLKG